MCKRSVREIKSLMTAVRQQAHTLDIVHLQTTMFVTFGDFTDAYPLRFTRRLTLRRAPHFIDPNQMALHHGDTPIATLYRSDARAFAKVFDADPQLRLRVTGAFLGPKKKVMHATVEGLRFSTTLAAPQG